MSMDIYQFQKGRLPLLISVPHAGVHIPDSIAAHMTDVGRDSVDSDRHVDQLYDFARTMGAGMVSATHSRYVVDLNRSSDDQNLYPGQDTTGLCPIDSFEHSALYEQGYVLDEVEISNRIVNYWQPYHAKLATELQRLKDQYGYALLWDAHSIKSSVPRFFEGKLPDINLGTANGSSCAKGLGEALLGSVFPQNKSSTVLNGRFTGGFITRHYGDPENNIHAVQLELSQITYMDEEAPFNYRPDLVADIQPQLKALLECFLASFQADGYVQN